MRGRVDGLCTQCFAEAPSENWPDRRQSRDHDSRGIESAL
jgi:hypothetical protein